jgi:hypothetical protein
MGILAAGTPVFPLRAMNGNSARPSVPGAIRALVMPKRRITGRGADYWCLRGGCSYQLVCGTRSLERVLDDDPLSAVAVLNSGNSMM